MKYKAKFSAKALQYIRKQRVLVKRQNAIYRLNRRYPVARQTVTPLMVRVWFSSLIKGSYIDYSKLNRQAKRIQSERARLERSWRRIIQKHQLKFKDHS